MGAAMDKALKPEELVVFRKIPMTENLLPNIEIPERAENRRPTDPKFLIAFIVIAVILIPFLIYTLAYSDFSRYGGYDTCGNICGEENDKYDQWPCTGKDFRDKPYLKYDRPVNPLDVEIALLTSRECVSEVSTCKYGEDFTGNCLGDDENIIGDKEFNFSKLNAYLRTVAWRITLACFLSLGFTLAILVLFRTATAAMVWSILAGVFVFGVLCVGACWFSYSIMEDPVNKQQLLYLSIVLTVILIILFCVVVFLHKKIKLVIILLKEAMKAAFAMPQLIFIPILTFLAQVIIIILLGVTSAYMFTSGTLKEITSGYLAYEPNFFMIFTIVFNFCMAFWALQFFNGIQYMVIAGAVSKWYFSPNKDRLVTPIKTSAVITFKFHLGSIAFGSLIITIIAIIRALLRSITSNQSLKACGDFCMRNIEDFLKFLSKNSYILTAMHGKPFYKSGKRAAKIILENVVNIAAVNCIGDFIIAMAQIIIVLISMLLTYGIMMGAESEYVPAVYLIVLIVSIIVGSTFFAIFETVIDTLFLCFCEDSLLNDGMARPYAMSRDLMEFVEKSKMVFKNKDK